MLLLIFYYLKYTPTMKIKVQPQNVDVCGDTLIDLSYKCYYIF